MITLYLNLKRVVTLLDSTQNITILESDDDVEAELVESEGEGDEEKGNTLVCT